MYYRAHTGFHCETYAIWPCGQSECGKTDSLNFRATLIRLEFDYFDFSSRAESARNRTFGFRVEFIRNRLDTRFENRPLCSGSNPSDSEIDSKVRNRYLWLKPELSIFQNSRFLIRLLLSRSRTFDYQFDFHMIEIDSSIFKANLFENCSKIESKAQNRQLWCKWISTKFKSSSGKISEKINW